MTKRAFIVQSNYIPWKGYFDAINMVDEFIIYDEVQYTRRDWRNRNKIKTHNGTIWLTIPVVVKGKYHQKINETKVSDQIWANKHWETIRHSYLRSTYFSQYADLFEELYLSANEQFLSEINYRFIVAVNKILGIRTRITRSCDYDLLEGKNERLIGLCKQVGATKYLSGPAAKHYVDESLFNDEGIEVSWVNYSNYPEYDQLFPPFEHSVSIIDLIFNKGPDATKFMKSFGAQQ